MQVDPPSLDARANYRLLISCVVPRPIALVSTVSSTGVFNAAPFSMFTAVSSNPPMLAIAVASRRGADKDTTRNIKAGGDFVVNVVDEALAQKMNLCSADLPPDRSEFHYAGLTPAPSLKVSSPRVAEAPISMECRLDRIVSLGSSPTNLIIGKVLLYHVADRLVSPSRAASQDDVPVAEVAALRPVGRLGELLYCRVRDVFEMKRPRH